MYYLKDIISDSVLPVIPAVILGSRYNKLPAPLKLLFYFLISTIILFSVSNFLADKMINNLFIYHFYTVLNFIVLLIFLNEIFNLFKLKYVLIILITVLLCITNILFLEPINTFDTIAVIITNAILLSLTIWGFIKCIKNEILLQNVQYYVLLIMFGIFIFSASSIIVYSYFKYNSLFKHKISNKIWFLYDNVMILKYTCYTIAAILWRKSL